MANSKKITGYTGGLTEITIPTAIGGVPVRFIAPDAIPATVTKINANFCSDDPVIAGAPWGAENATIEYKDITVKPHAKRVGGRIYYVDPANYGATYKFYDANNNELTTQTKEGLANAVTYTVTGTPTQPKFYVYNNTDQSNVIFGKYGTEIGITTDGMGQGKANTTAALNTTGWENNSVFTYAKKANDNKIGGCGDWCVMSKAELTKFAESGLLEEVK